jgi:prolipoprotein diacylglyceryltransferase
MQLLKKDIEEIDRANQETCKYFAYICQFMLIFMFYSVFRMAVDSARAFDVIDIFLTLSYLMMLFGVSISIKTSVDKAVRESRLQNEINVFEEVQ